MTPRWIALTLAAGALASATAGCLFMAAGAAAGGTLVYVKGELQETLAAPLDRTADATERAIAQLGLKTLAVTRQGQAGQFSLLQADGSKVAIELESTGPGLTRVGVRVGLVGDRDVSQRILTAIRENL